MKMAFRISILSTGDMGRALGRRFALLGDSVSFSGRDPNEAPLRAFQKPGINARSFSLEEAAEFGEIIVWTARERNPVKIFSSMGVIKELEGKVIIDLNNRDYANEVLGDENNHSRWFNFAVID